MNVNRMSRTTTAAFGAVLLPLFLAACTSEPDGSGLQVPADRPILDWTGKTASDANAKLFPSGFTGPDEHACAKDPTRQYIGELFTTGIDDIEVDYHWAPIVPGPVAGHRTIGQPEFSIAGTALDVNDSGDDVLADHPFGLDVNSDIALDAPYAFASFQPDETSAGMPTIHTEIETRILPRDALGYKAAKGDRQLQRGVWVLDCGHPPYGAEMHPPSFYAAARSADATTTEAVAVYVPYRSSLLFSQDVSLADAFSDDSRFTQPGVEPFSHALVTAVIKAVTDKLQNISAHALMVANRFDSLSFLVCAPLPRPAGATLDATWRFAARTGVKIEATPDDPSGCVQVVATMGAAYAPAPLAHVDAPWGWQQLSDSASSQAGQTIDVRQEIIKIVQGQGIDPSGVAALQVDHPPRIDAYPALQTRADADKDAPTAIDAKADEQPYPFYGRVRAAWKK
jgi:hypothetical protein